MRQRIDPDTPADRRQTSLARKVLGELMESLARGGLYQGKLRREFDDGTVVIAQFDGTTPIVTVQAPEGTAAPVSVATIDLWIPHGFVFTPGDDSATKGYGLPVVPDTARGSSADPFDAKNVVPGIEKSRWTKNGTCGQVLITRDDTSDYPRTRKRRIPICFDSHEWRTGAYTAPAADKWHAQRPVFNDFTWNAPMAGPRQGLWRALVAAIAKPMALPFAGYYDDAQLYADLSATYGTDETHWPLHYTSPTARANADGVPYSYAEVWSTGAPPIPALQAGLGAVPSGCPLLDVGEQRAFVTATLREPDAWIRAGNQSWIPKDAALPILTWDGYPAQNMPQWLVSGGWVAGVGGDVFPLSGWFYEWRQSGNRMVWSNRLYAMGRCIGVLPDTVVAAAIRSESVAVQGSTSGATKKVNRIVVITHRASDQHGTNYGITYLWKFRVWCLDCDVVATVPLHLVTPPVGAYDVTSNPHGWRECGAFTVFPDDDGTFPTLPRNSIYQMFRFSGDGKRAVTVSGYAPYEYEWGPTHTAEILFNAVAPGVLSYAIPEPVQFDYYDYGFILAVDYDDAGNFVYVWYQTSSTPAFNFTTQLPGPDGNMYYIGEGVLWWSNGGAPQNVSDEPFATFDYQVLDARDGAFTMLDHWDVCAGAKYDVRMLRAGELIDVSWYPDNDGGAPAYYGNSNYLDRIHASYARTRAGDWLMGYDLGVTAGTSVIYSPFPVCGEPYPPAAIATESSFYGSAWLSSVGDVAAMTKVNSGAMRAFPIGVV